MNLQRLKEAVEYNPDTGILRWKIRPLSHFKDEDFQKAWNKRYAGKKIGGIQSSNGINYLVFRFDGKGSLVHRAIWLLVTGSPAIVVDHINGDGTDNRWVNLRATDNFGNMKNMRPRKNKALPIGISMDRNKYAASICANNKHYHLGRFTDLDQAVAARKKAEAEHGFHPNHGKTFEREV